MLHLAERELEQAKELSLPGEGIRQCKMDQPFPVCRAQGCRSVRVLLAEVTQVRAALPSALERCEAFLAAGSHASLRGRVRHGSRAACGGEELLLLAGRLAGTAPSRVQEHPGMAGASGGAHGLACVENKNNL